MRIIFNFLNTTTIKDPRSCDIQKEFIQDLDNLKLAAYFEKGSCSRVHLIDFIRG
jgi:hypothetical protein